MKRYTAIINLNIEVEIKAKNKEKAMEEVENIELPNGYVEDSFEVVKLISSSGREL